MSALRPGGSAMDIVGLIERLPRLHRGVVWLVLVLLAAAVAVPVVWRIADEASANRRLAEVTAALDCDDPHWRWADLVTRRAVVPDAENGALVVRQIGFLLLGFGTSQSRQLFQELERLP